MLKRRTGGGALRKRYGRALGLGSRVTVMFGGRETDATVIEDRGNLGVQGGRVLRIRIETDDGQREFEVPADELTPARRRKTNGRAA